MPVGKTLATYEGTLTSVRVCEGSGGDRGAGYLDSGGVESYKAAGAYWATSQGNWETRAAAVMGDQMLVVEGQITMSDGDFSVSGTVSELT